MVSNIDECVIKNNVCVRKNSVDIGASWGTSRTINDLRNSAHARRMQLCEFIADDMGRRRVIDARPVTKRAAPHKQIARVLSHARDEISSNLFG